jgi:hypothetical protein
MFMPAKEIDEVTKKTEEAVLEEDKSISALDHQSMLMTNSKNPFNNTFSQ